MNLVRRNLSLLFKSIYQTQVFYSSTAQIGRLIENLSQGMDSGSFNFAPSPSRPGHSASSSLSTNELSMEERLELVLGSLNRGSWFHISFFHISTCYVLSFMSRYFYFSPLPHFLYFFVVLSDISISSRTLWTYHHWWTRSIIINIMVFEIHVSVIETKLLFDLKRGKEREKQKTRNANKAMG